MNEISTMSTSAINEMLADMLSAATSAMTSAVPALLAIVGVIAIGMFTIKIAKRIVSKAG
ncbi:hypothetical protein G8C15_10715 [Enterococcus casseliflavus]|nr:hypothetical protein [Enterococcus casseliflavus]MBF0015172.1 hypothetical protein [Enterococcus casseliflavus]